MKVVANKRDAQGTSASRRLRHTGQVPGILYGGTGAAQAIEVEHNGLFHALRKEKFHASILDMELDGQSERVLLRDFQMHPYKPLVLHVDFQRVAENQKIHIRIPLHFSGQEESPAFKAGGGLISHVMSEVDVACLPKDLPEFIAVDLSGSAGPPDGTRARPQDADRRDAGTQGQGKPGRRRGVDAWRAGRGRSRRRTGGRRRGSGHRAEGPGGSSGCRACEGRQGKKRATRTRRSNRHARRGAPDALARPAQSSPLPLRQRAFSFSR